MAFVCLLLPTAALAGKLTVTDVLIVGRAAPGEAWSDAPTEARLDTGAELAVVLVAKDGKKSIYIVDDDIAPLVVKRKKVPSSRRRTWDSIGSAKTRWSYVEPHAWRPEGQKAANGAGTPYYSNVVTGGDRHGTWLGYDKIAYFSTPIGTFADGAAARRRPATATPPRAEDDLYGGLGTMRYQVEVQLDGHTLASAGPDAVDTLGILPRVHRVTIRSDDTFLGRLTGYFLVPEVFGSAGPGRNHQTDRYTGADCADVLIGALREAGYRNVDYSHVAGLTTYAKVLVDARELDERGVPVDGEITGVALGDIIRVDYSGAWGNDTPRTWDHVAVLYEDKSDPAGPHGGAADGKLDGFDLVVHMGHPHLVVERLADQAPAKIDVLRWDAEKIGARR